MVGVVVIQSLAVVCHPAGVGVEEAGLEFLNAGVCWIILLAGQDVTVVLLELELVSDLVPGYQPETSLQLITSHCVFVLSNKKISTPTRQNW